MSSSSVSSARKDNSLVCDSLMGGGEGKQGRG